MTAFWQQSILLLDGGLGTTLEDEHEVKFSSETPLWSSHFLVNNPGVLQNVHRDFVEAGADVILTATYQASFDGFANTKINGSPISDQQARNYMCSAVRLARSAFGGRPGMVALSLGAYGATMVPGAEYSGAYGSMDKTGLVQFHRERIEVFLNDSVWSEIDIVAFETLPRLDEVEAVKEVMRQIPDKPYWISCVFPNEDRLPDGSSISLLVEKMFEGPRPPSAIGLNCTKIFKVANLVQQFEAAVAKLPCDPPRLVLYPDGAGDQIYDTKSQEWIGGSDDSKDWSEEIASIVSTVEQRGQWKGILLGGCCKTRPRDIASLKQRLQN